MGRVRCVPSEEADRRYREFNLCELELVLKSGQRKEVRVEYHRGHWRNPMTDAEVEAKFRALVEPRYGRATADAVLDRCWKFDEALLWSRRSNHR